RRAEQQGGPGHHRRPGAARRQQSARRKRARPPGTASSTDHAGRRVGGTELASMQIRPDEITKILKDRIEGLEQAAADLAEVGTVLSIGDGISRVHGLENVMSMEMLELPHDVTGLALNLEADHVGPALFGDWVRIEGGG